MRVLITGSSGQIGTNLALRLLSMGHEVLGIDVRPNPWRNDINVVIQDLSSEYTNFENGIGRIHYPTNLDVVVHLAANAKVYELVEQPSRALDNITMTFNVLEFCRHNNIPIVFSSTREVYGDIHHYITEEADADFAFTESPYSASKISSEALIYSYARCYQLPYFVFRFSNVYGRYDCDLERMERVIPLFIYNLMHEKPITIYGATKMLDFTYIDDCIDGVVVAIEHLVQGELKNQTVNLAYGQGNSLISLANYISEYLGIIPEIIVEPSRSGEVTHYVANIDKARALLGYDPKYPLQQGIAKAMEWTRTWWNEHSYPPETSIK